MLSEQEIKHALRAPPGASMTIGNPHGPFGWGATGAYGCRALPWRRTGSKEGRSYAGDACRDLAETGATSGRSHQERGPACQRFGGSGGDIATLCGGRTLTIPSPCGGYSRSGYRHGIIIAQWPVHFNGFPRGVAWRLLPLEGSRRFRGCKSPLMQNGNLEMSPFAASIPMPACARLFPHPEHVVTYNAHTIRTEARIAAKYGRSKSGIAPQAAASGTPRPRRITTPRRTNKGECDNCRTVIARAVKATQCPDPIRQLPKFAALIEFSENGIEHRDEKRQQNKGRKPGHDVEQRRGPSLRCPRIREAGGVSESLLVRLPSIIRHLSRSNAEFVIEHSQPVCYSRAAEIAKKNRRRLPQT